jgi:hypothetical protein
MISKETLAFSECSSLAISVKYRVRSQLRAPTNTSTRLHIYPVFMASVMASLPLQIIASPESIPAKPRLLLPMSFNGAEALQIGAL